MATTSLIVSIFVLILGSMLVDARLLITNTTTTTASAGSLTLTARLKLEGGDGGDGGSTGCWESLFELQSCTGEIILFFLNGETYLGTGCCRAIEKIEKQCWPSLLGSLGFTSEEGDILRGYCDASADNGDAPTTTPPPQTANTTTSNATTVSGDGRF